MCSPYTDEATTIAKLFVEKSEYGLYDDPSFTVSEIVKVTTINTEKAEQAIYELERYEVVSLHRALGMHLTDVLIRSQHLLFIEFDHLLMPWKPKEDAKRIARDVIDHEDFPTDPRKIANRYKWELRRLNPAINYLVKERVIRNAFSFGIHPLTIKFVQAIHPTINNFVKDFL